MTVIEIKLTIKMCILEGDINTDPQGESSRSHCSNPEDLRISNLLHTK